MVTTTTTSKKKMTNHVPPNDTYLAPTKTSQQQKNNNNNKTSMRMVVKEHDDDEEEEYHHHHTNPNNNNNNVITETKPHPQPPSHVITAGIELCCQPHVTFLLSAVFQIHSMMMRIRPSSSSLPIFQTNSSSSSRTTMKNKKKMMMNNKKKMKKSSIPKSQSQQWESIHVGDIVAVVITRKLLPLNTDDNDNDDNMWSSSSSSAKVLLWRPAWIVSLLERPHDSDLWMRIQWLDEHCSNCCGGGCCGCHGCSKDYYYDDDRCWDKDPINNNDDSHGNTNHPNLTIDDYYQPHPTSLSSSSSLSSLPSLTTTTTTTTATIMRCWQWPSEHNNMDQQDEGQTTTTATVVDTMMNQNNTNRKKMMIKNQYAMVRVQDIMGRFDVMSMMIQQHPNPPPPPPPYDPKSSVKPTNHNTTTTNNNDDDDDDNNHYCHNDFTSSYTTTLRLSYVPFWEPTAATTIPTTKKMMMMTTTTFCTCHKHGGNSDNDNNATNTTNTNPFGCLSQQQQQQPDKKNNTLFWNLHLPNYYYHHHHHRDTVVVKTTKDIPPDCSKTSTTTSSGHNTCHEIIGNMLLQTWANHSNHNNDDDNDDGISLSLEHTNHHITQQQQQQQQQQQEFGETPWLLSSSSSSVPQLPLDEACRNSLWETLQERWQIPSTTTAINTTTTSQQQQQEGVINITHNTDVIPSQPSSASTALQQHNIIVNNQDIMAPPVAKRRCSSVCPRNVPVVQSSSCDDIVVGIDPDTPIPMPCVTETTMESTLTTKDLPLRRCAPGRRPPTRNKPPVTRIKRPLRTTTSKQRQQQPNVDEMVENLNRDDTDFQTHRKRNRPENEQDQEKPQQANLVSLVLDSMGPSPLQDTGHASTTCTTSQNAHSSPSLSSSLLDSTTNVCPNDNDDHDYDHINENVDGYHDHSPVKDAATTTTRTTVSSSSSSSSPNQSPANKSSSSSSSRVNNDYQALTTTLPFHIDLASRRAYYKELDMIPLYQNFAIYPLVGHDTSCSQNDIERVSSSQPSPGHLDHFHHQQQQSPQSSSWKVRMGDVVAVQAETVAGKTYFVASNQQRQHKVLSEKSSKYFPFTVPWSVGEIVTIWRNFASAEETQAAATLNHIKKDVDKLNIEIRWFYRESEMAAASTYKNNEAHRLEEVFETDQVDADNNVDCILAPVQLVDHGTTPLGPCSQFHDLGMPIVTMYCHRFWSVHRGSLIPCGGLNGRIGRARIHSTYIAKDAALRIALERTESVVASSFITENSKDSSLLPLLSSPSSSSKPSWRDAFAKVIMKMTLTDASDAAKLRSSGLIGRESEQKVIFNFLRDAVCGKAKMPSLFVGGPPGVGKTASVRYAIEKLQHDQATGSVPRFHFVSLNGMEMLDPFESYVKLCESLSQFGKKRRTPETAAALLEAYFTRDDSFDNDDSTGPNITVVLLDEIDYLVTKKQTVLYNFFDWPLRAAACKHGRKLIVVGISNILNLPEKLLPSVQSRIGSERCIFKAYNAVELTSILNTKIREASPDFVTFEADAVTFAAKKTAVRSGDLRRAMQTCRVAAENILKQIDQGIWQPTRRSNSNHNEMPMVRIGDIQKASRETFSSTVTSTLSSLMPFEVLVIVAIASLGKHTGRTKGGFDVQEVMTKIESIAGTCGEVQFLPSPSFSEVIDILQRLDESQLITLYTPRSSGRSFRAAQGGSGGAWPLISLPMDYQDVRAALRDSPYRSMAETFLSTGY